MSRGNSKFARRPTSIFSGTTSPHYSKVLKAIAGKPALMFNTGEITWLSPTEVEISCGYYEGVLSSSLVFCRVQKTGGSWKVTREVRKYIS